MNSTKFLNGITNEWRVENKEVIVATYIVLR